MLAIRISVDSKDGRRPIDFTADYWGDNVGAAHAIITKATEDLAVLLAGELHR